MDENITAESTPNSQTFGLKERFTTVTPLSKFLAMTLFVALPFIGFWVGIQFQSTHNIPIHFAEEFAPSASSSTVVETLKYEEVGTPTSTFKTISNKEYGLEITYPTTLTEIGTGGRSEILVSLGFCTTPDDMCQEALRITIQENNTLDEWYTLISKSGGYYNNLISAPVYEDVKING